MFESSWFAVFKTDSQTFLFKPAAVILLPTLTPPCKSDIYLHLSQVLHAPGDLPSKRDQVAHGKCSVVWVLQVAGVAVGVPAHVTGANFPTLTQEVTQRPELGVLHDQIQRPYSERKRSACGELWTNTPTEKRG